MAKIFIAGHRGMVGSAIFRHLQTTDHEVITASRSELDLGNQLKVSEYFSNHKFDQVYLAAAKVGGIHANNTYPANFIYENLMIQNNVIHNSYVTGVKKLLFLGSSCIYPRLAEQPMREKSLLSGPLEQTNEPYAIAKIAGIKMCESYNRQHGVDYRSVMPTNLYGPGDNFHAENSHVVPALIRRLHEAKIQKSNEVVVWGSGSPLREFLHVDDMAAASLFVQELDQQKYSENTTAMLSHINVGSGKEISIRDLALLIADVVGYQGLIIFDSTKPDGAPRKLMDSSKLKKMGWKSKVNFRDGLEGTYKWFLEYKNDIRH